VVALPVEAAGVAAGEDGRRGEPLLAIAEVGAEAGDELAALGAGLPDDATESVDAEEPQAVALTARANPAASCEARTKSREEGICRA
jgi:hypothetical protein